MIIQHLTTLEQAVRTQNTCTEHEKIHFGVDTIHVDGVSQNNNLTLQKTLALMANLIQNPRLTKLFEAPIAVQLQTIASYQQRAGIRTVDQGEVYNSEAISTDTRITAPESGWTGCRMLQPRQPSSERKGHMLYAATASATAPSAPVAPQFYLPSLAACT